MKKYWKWIGAILLVVLLGLGAFVGDYFHDFALDTHIDKSKISQQDSDGNEDPRLKENQDWFLVNQKLVQMTSVTGEELVGHVFLNPDAKKWVIVLHGYSSKAFSMANYVKNFYDAGYNVLAPDLIAHGESTGTSISMGGFDSKDLRKWIEQISTDYHHPDIALFGISMGAATVMNTLDEDLPANVKLFIEDSGYVSLNDEFSYQLKKLFQLPAFPIIPLADLATRVESGYFFESVNAEKALANTSLPALILHGEEDGFVPPENAQKVYELLQGTKELHTFPNAKHCKAERLYSEEYWGIIHQFLANYF